jgi:signal transduction histidine kinase
MDASTTPNQLALEARWNTWLLERNRSGTRALLWIAGGLYPLFGILDFFVAKGNPLVILLTTRVVVTAITFTLLARLKSPLFARFPYLYSAGYLVLAGAGISLMTVFLGGLASIYYAGLSLVLVASGLLFVWPLRVVILTYSAVVLSFLLENLLINGVPTDIVDSVANLFFLLSTALLVTAGQMISYRSLHEQLASQVAVEHAGERLEHANEQLRQLDEFRTRFFANITHEFKTPLTIMMTPLQNLIRGTGTTLEKPQLQAMYRSCLQVLKLVDDLLDLARSEEAQLRLRLRERDLVPHLAGLVVDAQVIAHRKDIELLFVTAVDSALVWCDLERLDRVFVNLLANALKFTPDHGKVGVMVWEWQDRIIVQTADTGTGFGPGVAERVFERFFQEDGGSTRRYGGAGIGLALAREIALLHGATITASAVPGVGATFTVTLRRGKAHFPDKAIAFDLSPDAVSARGLGGMELPEASLYRLLDIETATEKRRIDRDPTDSQHRFSVLVVDDNTDVVHAIHETLRGEFKVYAAADGEEGFERAVRLAPTLIILDYMMPKMDGIQLLGKLRADPRTRLTPVVMLSARADVEIKITGVELGVSHYLAKPFDTRELLAIVRRFVHDQERTAEVMLHRQLDSLEVITSALAHQINNPLNYLKGALKVIRRDTSEALSLTSAANGAGLDPQSAEALEQRLRRMFDTVEAGIRRIGDTVELMRRYSRDGYLRDPVTYPLFDATRDVLRLVLPTAQADVHIETSFSGHGFIDCVPDEMNQVITNLVQNAIDALNGKGGGRLSVIGTTNEREVLLTIRDDGPGIAPENRARLFTPFFSTKGQGMGMGLFICHRIVNALGGAIQVDSEVGRGTEMVMRVPASQRPATAVETSAAPPAA